LASKREPLVDHSTRGEKADEAAGTVASETYLCPRVMLSQPIERGFDVIDGCGGRRLRGASVINGEYIDLPLNGQTSARSIVRLEVSKNEPAAVNIDDKWCADNPDGIQPARALQGCSDDEIRDRSNFRAFRPESGSTQSFNGKRSIGFPSDLANPPFQLSVRDHTFHPRTANNM